MSNLTIKVGGVTLNYQREDLNIKKDNNALRSSFNVAHTSYPLRVINDDKAKAALGDLSIRAATKRIAYDCEINIGPAVYNGKLEVRRPSDGQFIEVDITFGSILVALVDKKLWEFLPNVNVKGDDPAAVPYTEESNEEHNAQEFYKAQAAIFIDKTFPEIYYQYPQLNHNDRYEDTAPDEDHRFYTNRVNARDANSGDLLLNSTTFNDIEIVPFNLTAVSPQVYAMAPIVRAFESLGYGIEGTFVDHAIFNLLLFTSFEDQMTEVAILPPSTSFAISGNWQVDIFTGFPGHSFVLSHFIRSFLPYPEIAGDYKVVINFDMTAHNPAAFYGVSVQDRNGQNIGAILQNEQEILKQEFSFSVNQNNSTDQITFTYLSQSQEFPFPFSLLIVPDVDDTILYDAHPTIEFNRYVPDWNIIEAVNNFKNLFNLDVYINDVERVVYMNFNELQLAENDWVSINARFRESEIQSIAQEHFTLGMDNDDDTVLLIDNEGATVSNSVPAYTTEIRTKFKEVPYSNGTAVLSEDLKDRSGVGLMIYNISLPPLIASSFAGVSLKMDGSTGIYTNFWQVWLRYRLNASPLTLSGPLTNTEIIQIEKLQRFYMNNQKYMVDTMNISDAGGLFLQATINVESVNF